MIQELEAELAFVRSDASRGLQDAQRAQDTAERAEDKATALSAASSNSGRISSNDSDTIAFRAMARLRSMLTAYAEPLCMVTETSS